MTAAERRASFGLAGIYGLRMLGLFIILPVFALYAEHLPGGESHLLIGIALGAYGLTQAILQIPAGWLSDRYGRKPVIYGGLVVFALAASSPLRRIASIGLCRPCHSGCGCDQCRSDGSPPTSRVKKCAPGRWR